MSSFLFSYNQTSLDSDYSAMGETFDKSTMTVQFVYPDCFIQVDHGIVLHVKNIVQTNFKIQASGSLQYQNGYPILIPNQYKSLFQQILLGTQKIAYTFKSYMDNFGLVLKLNLKSSNFNQGFDAQDDKLIQRCLLKLRQSLILSGILKCKNKLSLQILKQTLKLQKFYVDCLRKNNQGTQNFQIIKLSAFQLSNLLQVKQIKQSQNMMANQKQLQKGHRKGGYFMVEKKNCDIIHKDGSQTKNVELALKKLRTSKSKDGKNRRKAEKELNIVGNIKKNKYLVNYYTTKVSNNQFYMDYIQRNLKQLIYEDNMKIRQIFNISKQIIEAIQILHQYGVVHRDLKLQNIMIQQKNGQKTVKIIDFGESAHMGVVIKQKHNLGCTPPYSPIQCLFDDPEGFNKNQIDLWSVIVVIYEMAFKNVPIYYNRIIQAQIMFGWKGQGEFDPVLSIRPKRGIRKIQQIFSLMSDQGLKINQRERLQLKTIGNILKGIETFYDELVALGKKQ